MEIDQEVRAKNSLEGVNDCKSSVFTGFTLLPVFTQPSQLSLSLEAIVSFKNE